MSKALIKDMFENVVHIGHRTYKWNPLMKKYIYGDRGGIHVINLEKTAECLDAALKFVNKHVSSGKNIMFVSTKPQAVNLIEEKAKSVGMPYVVSKWIPGMLTNFSTIKVRIKYLADLKEQKMTGEFEKYTKKEAAKLEKTIVKLETALGGVSNMTSKPDAIFLADIYRDQIVVKEANKLGIPVIGIADTNSDPSGVDFPIPANDDAIKSLNFVMDQVVGAIKKSR